MVHRNDVNPVDAVMCNHRYVCATSYNRLANRLLLTFHSNAFYQEDLEAYQAVFFV